MSLEGEAESLPQTAEIKPPSAIFSSTNNILFGPDLGRKSKIVAEKVESYKREEEEVLSDPDLKWVENGVFSQKISPDFYGALSRVVSGREQKGDAEMLSENWMFLEYIKKGLEEDEKQTNENYTGTFDIKNVTIHNRVYFTHQCRDLIMELVSLPYFGSYEEYYQLIIIAVRSEKEKEMLHIHMYNDLCDKNSFRYEEKRKLFSYQGKIYSFFQYEIKQIIFDGESIKKIDILLPEETHDVLVDYSGYSVICVTIRETYRLGQLHSDRIEILMTLEGHHIYFIDPLDRVWLAGDRINNLKILSPDSTILYQGNRNQSVDNRDYDIYQLGTECYYCEEFYYYLFGCRMSSRKLFRLALEQEI